MKQLGLLIRLIIGIIAGILIGMCGQWFGIADTAFFVTIIRLLATFTSLFSTFLSFMIPLIILSFITVGMAELGKKANRLFGLTLLLAYGTTVISGLLTFFIGKAVLPGLIQPITGDVLESNAFEPLFSITVDPIFGVMTALVLAFVLGIMEMFSQAKAIAASQVSMLPYVIAGVIYWVFNFIVEIVLTRIEKKLNYYHD